MTTLKVCPFCGAEPEQRIYKRQRKYRNLEGRKVAKFAKVVNIEARTEKIVRQRKVLTVPVTIFTVEWDEYVVCCSNTSCIARNVTRTYRDYNVAARKWNRRKDEENGGNI